MGWKTSTNREGRKGNRGERQAGLKPRQSCLWSEITAAVAAAAVAAAAAAAETDLFDVAVLE